MPDLGTERDSKKSRPQVKRSLSEGHVSAVSLEEVLFSLKEWQQNKVCTGRARLIRTRLIRSST